MKNAFVFAVFAASAVLTVHAAVWTGAVNENWGEAGNWDPEGVPTSGEASIPENKTVQVADGDMETSVNRLATLRLMGSGSKVVFNTTDPFTCALAGTGEVVKASSSSWTMSKSQPDYIGTFTLKAGLTRTMKPGGAKSFGSNARGVGPLNVEPGATYDFSGPAGSGDTIEASHRWFEYREVRVAGDGCDGKGALVNTVTEGYHMVRYLTLTGDASFTFPKFATSRMDGSFVFNMNHHTLTMSGKTDFRLYAGFVTNAGPHRVVGTSSTDKASLYAWDGFRLGSPDDLTGTATLEFGANSSLCLRNSGRHLRPIKVSGGGTVRCDIASNDAHGGDTNYNNLAGPVEIASGTTLSAWPDDSANLLRMLTVSGPLSGGGTLQVNLYGKVALACDRRQDDFTGSIYVQGNYSGNVGGASMIAYHTNAIPDYSKLTVNMSRMTVTMDTWQRPEILRLANEATLSDGGVIALDTSALAGQSGTLALTDDDIVSPTFGLGHDGPGTLSLTGPLTKPLRIVTFGGVLRLTGDEPVTLGDVDVTGNRGSYSGVLEISDTSSVALSLGKYISVGSRNLYETYSRPILRFRDCTFAQQRKDSGFYGGTAGILVGNRGNGIVEIKSGADVTTTLQVGNTRNQNYGAGAVYQDGGKLTVVGGDNDSSSNDALFYLGKSSYGYCGVFGGTFELQGMGFVGNTADAQGILDINGGTFVHTPHSKGSAGSHYLMIAAKNNAALHVRNGGSYLEQSAFLIHSHNDSTANGEITVEGAGSRFVSDAYTICMGYGVNTASSMISVSDGGLLQVRDIVAKGKCPVLNLDGGILRASAGQNVNLLTGVSNIFVYARGAVIDTNGRSYRTEIKTPIRAPGGLSVTAVALPDAVAKATYIGPPLMRIVGDGIGASVAADWDRATQKVTGIRIIAPGSGYSEATLQLNYGITHATYEVVTLGAVTDGGITKAGEGSLTLSATNTYGGATVIAGGTLKCGVDGAIPGGSRIVLAGGTLDMNGKKLGDGSSAPADWAIDLQRVRAEGPVVYDGDLAFPSDSALTLLNGDELPVGDDVRKLDLLTVTGTLSGEPELAGLTSPDWHFRWVGKTLRLVKNSGTILLVR